jgi:hypothetical protein
VPGRTTGSIAIPRVLGDVKSGPVQSQPVPKVATDVKSGPVQAPPVPKVVADVKSGPIPTRPQSEPRAPQVARAIPKIPEINRPPTGQMPRIPAHPTVPLEAQRSDPTPRPQEVDRAASSGIDSDAASAESLVDANRFDDALVAYRLLVRRHPQERAFRAGIELCEGLKALAERDRMEAAQRFEAALEIDPSNERAARELAEMRRLATNERKGLLSRLMGKKEP